MSPGCQEDARIFMGVGCLFLFGGEVRIVESEMGLMIRDGEWKSGRV